MDNNKLIKDIEKKQEYIKFLEEINENLRKYIKEMSGVYKIIEALNSIKDINIINDLILDLLNDIIPIKASAIFFYDDEKKIYKQIKTRQVEILEKIKEHFKIDNKIYDWIIKKKHLTIIPQPKYIEDKKLFDVSLAIAPIYTSNKDIGYIEIVINKKQSKITQNEISILNLVIKQFSLIVENLNIIEIEKMNLKRLKEIEEIKNDILVTASHELRTPLTIMKGAIKVIEVKMEDNMWEEEDKSLYIEFIKNVNKQIEILEEIVNSMFMSISIEGGFYKINKENINIKEIIESLIKKYRQKYKNIEYFFNFELDSEKYLCDKIAFKKIIDNLLSNASKFVDKDGKVFVNVKKSDNKALFIIEDTGIGIAEEEQKKIFNLFYRVDKSITRKKGGIGLGLYITKKIVELHNGEIWVESEIGKGTKIYFTL